ncbi:MAG: NAD(P)/FAD-dependent oxidoreductase [Sphingobium sp.]
MTNGIGRKLKIAVIGAGASGVMAVIRLREIGQDDVRIFEKASDMGGTWRDNRYPGVACDVPSHLYRLSFEPNPDWTHVYSPGKEIWAYLRDVFNRHGIGDRIVYDAEVMKADFVDGRWLLETKAGNFGPFDVVITAMGILRYPLYPKIEGLESFAGITMHSARWDEGLELAGKRVGLIGCGSTGVQMATAMASKVGHLSLFQRTPQWILASSNVEISEEEKESYRRNPELMQQRYDYLAGEFNSRYAAAVVGDNPEAYERMVQACEQNLENNVRDPELREKLRPDYKVGCRRLVISDGFYDAVQRPNVELVTEAIERIEPQGIRTADGRLHEIDILALATGYDAHAGLAPMQVTGKDGLTLDEAWSEAQHAYLGVCVPEFPNFFMIGGPSSPIGNFSFLMTAETQMGYILGLVKHIAAAPGVEIHPRVETMDKLYQDIAERMPRTIWATGCKSWYMDKNGQIALWPWSYERFENVLREPDLEEFHVSAGH